MAAKWIGIKRFQNDQRGATAIEYALLAALIGVAMIGAMIAYTNSSAGIYTYIIATFDGAMRAAGL